MLQFKNHIRRFAIEELTAASFMQQNGLNKVEW